MENNIEKYFEELRFDKNHHLGLGDIRLTIGQQEEIIREFNLLSQEFKPCGDGDNVCNCKHINDCGYK